MNLIQAVILGIVQGLTEFLPVSSSAHLVVVQHLFGFKEPLVAFDVILHLGTLTALFVYLFRDLVRLVKNIFVPGPSTRLALGIVIASLPTAFIGFTFKDWFEALFGSLQAVGFALLGTTALLWMTRKLEAGRREIEKGKVLDFIFIGAMQGFAIIPGISRSGATLVTSLLRGFKKEDAFRFSFLLSIPAILGAGFLELRGGAGLGEINRVVLGAGFLASAFTGFFALGFLEKVILKGKLHRFAGYTLALGFVVLLSSRWFD